MSGLLRRLADGLLNPGKGGVHPLARLPWFASLPLRPNGAERRSEALPSREAGRSARPSPAPSRPDSAPPEPRSSPEPRDQLGSEPDGDLPSPPAQTGLDPPSAKPDAKGPARSPARQAAITVAPEAAQPTSAFAAAAIEEPERDPRARRSPNARGANELGAAALGTARPTQTQSPAAHGEAREPRLRTGGEVSPRSPQALLGPQAAASPAREASAVRTNAAAARERSEVQIHIGRIEVTAIQAQRPRKSPRIAALSLDDYLNQRSGEKR